MGVRRAVSDEMTLPVLVAALLIGVSASGCLQEPPGAYRPLYPAVDAAADPLFAVFESRIPCADCEKIKVALALYRDRDTDAPTTYKLARVYVARSPEDRIVVEGTWAIAHGTKLDPHAVVYQLDAHAPRDFQLYWAIGPDILFMLDEARNPRVGTAGYGYALNRTH